MQTHEEEDLEPNKFVFLEDWKPGHYFEGMDNPVTGWLAGDVVEWGYDAPHMAANLGTAPRYTLQITGHK
jgi:hypothetical protein